jgi:cellulose synthase/poly-beta-1,6-N-acetylglucosamine synthase-like glycosyltransferase
MVFITCQSKSLLSYMSLSPFSYILFILFCLVIIVQVFYYLYFFRRLAYYVPSTKKISQEYPVSVIICAKNEANNLVKNLPGIFFQNYRTTHEVIVVNDNSEDESKYILEEFQKRFKNLNVIPLTQEAILIPGKKFPLSMGIKSTRYEVILLTDADCIPASDQWIQKMQEGYAPGIDVVLGYGAYFKKNSILNKFIRFETFHTAMQYFSFALAGKPYMGVGRNLSYKRDIFIRNKGFSSINHIPGGDDDLFINKVATDRNTAIIIDKEAHTLSEPRTTWGEWMKQKNRHYTTSKYYKPIHKFLLGLYSLTNFLVYPLVILAAIFFNWWIVLILFLARLVLVAFIWKKCMNQLNEADLWPYFFLFDVLMMVYYIVFTPALFKKPSKKWR